MTDKPSPAQPAAIETIPSVVGSISAIASAQAPFIYFEGIPNFGFNFGIANMSLEVLRFTSNAAGQNVLVDRVTVAHLRFGPNALQQLKKAIEGIELLMTPVAEGTKN
jgi:hypothetical protein